MTCPKCNAECIDGSTFCIKCGANLKELAQVNVSTDNVEMPPTNQQFVQPEQPVVNEQPVQQPMQQSMNNVQPQQPVYNNGGNVGQASANVSSAPLNYLMYFIAILLKPFKSFKDEESKLNNTKTSFILALIITGGMTVINLIKTIFSTVRVANYSWTDGYTYSWEWSNLKNIKWIEVIGKNFLIYACIIFAIALVFYLASLIIKKQLSFIKSLSIASTSVIPAVIGAMILSPLAGKIWSPLSIVFMVVGGAYSLIILYELMNNELKLEGDAKIYFNLVCLGILAVAGYYAYMKLFMSSVTGGLDDLLDLFK